MGDAEVVGNLSVHWRVDHQDGQRLRVKDNEPNRPRANDAHNVSTDTRVQGRDPKQVQFFDVALRFESKADAQTQLQAAIAAVTAAPDGASFFLNFRVPATVNGMQRADPDTGPRPDIGVRW
jgi:hypothetical protein